MPTTPTTKPETRRPTLPPSRAFVVQIHASVDPTRETLVGRVEHLASGAAAHFADPAELVAFMRNTITDPRKENPSDE